MDRQTLGVIISSGENDKVEFKSSFNIETIESLVAFANTSGGKVYIGLTEKSVCGVNVNTETVQQWINEIKTKTFPILIPDAEIIDIDLKKVLVFSIQEYPIKPVSVRGRYYKRVANSNHLLPTSEVVNMHLQTFNTSWDYHLNNQFSMDDISLEKVQLAIDNMNRAGSSITDDPLTFLFKNDLVRDAAVSNAAFLLFKKNDSVLTTIELGRFQSAIIIKDSARTKADILTQAEQVLDFVKKHINKEVIITGKAQNIQKWQYPLEAIREIVLNMIVHRNYRSASDSIVKIYNDKIEFYNPGRLPDNITVEDLQANNYKSTPRNKLIADFCKNIGIIEKYGSGISRIIAYCLDAGLPSPDFRNISDGFMVTVFDQPKATEVKNVPKNVPKNRMSVIVECMHANRNISIRELALTNKVSPKTIKRDLERLRENGIIKRVGPVKGGYWEVLKNV